MGSDEVVHQLVEVAAEIARLEALAEKQKVRRDELIMKAITQKVPRAEIAVAAGLSEPMIYKIRKQSEESQ